MTPRHPEDPELLTDEDASLDEREAEEDEEELGEDDGRSLRVLRYKDNAALVAFITTAEGRSAQLLAELRAELWGRRGTNQARRSWRDPDVWLHEVLTGPLYELALVLWHRSRKTINPRYADRHRRVAQQLGLMTEVGGLMVATEAGRSFCADPAGDAVRAIDEREGLMELLALLDAHGPQPSVELQERWTEAIRARTTLRQPNSFKLAAQGRIGNLEARGLVARIRRDIALTDAGRAWLRAARPALDASAPLPAPPPPQAATPPAPTPAADAPWREEALAALTRALASHRIALLAGPPGAGKSALARALAHRLGRPLLHRHATPDGAALSGPFPPDALLVLEQPHDAAPERWLLPALSAWEDDPAQAPAGLQLIGVITTGPTTPPIPARLLIRSPVIALAPDLDACLAPWNDRPFAATLRALLRPLTPLAPCGPRLIDTIASALDRAGDAWPDALDRCALEHLLPHLSGPAELLTEPLEQLSHAATPLPRTSSRLQALRASCARYGFASFWSTGAGPGG